MARIHGRGGRLYVGLASSTAAAEPVAFIKKWSVKHTTDRADATALGDSNKVNLQGLPDASGDVDGFWDDSTVQTYTAAIDGSARRFYIYPAASVGTAGPYWYGTAFWDFEIEGAVDGAVTIKSSWAAASTVVKGP